MMLGSPSRGVVSLLLRDITFRLSQCMLSQSTNVTDGRTDRRHAVAIPRSA